MSTWVQVRCADWGESRLGWEPDDGVEPFDAACPYCGAEKYVVD